MHIDEVIPLTGVAAVADRDHTFAIDKVGSIGNYAEHPSLRLIGGHIEIVQGYVLAAFSQKSMTLYMIDGYILQEKILAVHELKPYHSISLVIEWDYQSRIQVSAYLAVKTDDTSRQLFDIFICYMPQRMIPGVVQYFLCVRTIQVAVDRIYAELPAFTNKPYLPVLDIIRILLPVYLHIQIRPFRLDYLGLRHKRTVPVH